MLKIRQAHDAAHAAWWQQVRAIEETSTEPLSRVIDIAFDLMAHPVFTVAEVREKLELVKEFDLLNLTDDERDLWGWLIQDALAVAEKAVSQA